MTRRTLTALVAYAALAGLGWAWAWAAGRTPWDVPAWLDLAPSTSWVLSVVLGLASTALFVGGSRLAVRHAEWARRMHRGFRDVLGPDLTDREIVVFAGASAIAEELFFRGAMQPTLGLPLTALVFGLVHVPPDRRFLPWTLVAVVGGLAFGAVVALTGNLVGAILAHALVNYLNLQFIRAHDLDAPIAAVPRAPSLVGGRARATRGLDAR
ncbi:MAG: CPBP family intramembrane metalloprotease [Sandaracinus sp.]|nr:CPBP family intramembrane metalloprotease [Sandaracinus sp.]